MPISTIAITDTIDFGRQVLNQISANINSLLSSGLTTTGNVTIRGSNSSLVALNVASGVIAGNGANIFSVNARSVTLNTIRNSQLQNAGITINASTGTNGGGFLALGSSISLNIVPNNSFVNSWTNVAVSAAAVSNANTIIHAAARNANLVTQGVLGTAYGGTGINSYSGSNGATLIGTTEGTLVSNTIRPGAGITAWYGNGSLSFTANLVAGQNVQITNGNQISINAPPLGTTTTNGVVFLEDGINSTSVTTAATANSVVAGYEQAVARLPSPNVYGRLLEMKIYSSPGVYTWTRPANTSHIEIVMIGAGGGGAGANSGNVGPGTTANTRFPWLQNNSYTCGMGGYAGALLYATIANSNLNSTMTITIGHAGNSSGALVGGRVGYKGGDTTFANSACTAQVYFANGGNGGMTITHVGMLMHANNPFIYTWNTIPRKRMYGYYHQENDPSVVPPLAKAGVPAIGQPRPEYFLTVDGEPPSPMIRLSSGNVIPSFGGSVPGWCPGGWVTYSTNTAISGQANCITFGPDGGSATQQPNGSGFGGGGGGGAYNESRGVAGPVSGASGANGLMIIKVYSRV